jgi:RNA 2',3'-cyclic 3'-phosphodiesterase
MPSTTERLFVGIPFPAALRDGLAAFLRASFGEGLPGRAVPPTNWHLTLRFLGVTDTARRARAVDELRRSAPARRFTISLDRLGAFPRAGRATVLWLGVGDGADELRALAAGAEAAAVRAGFAPEMKPFAPHLTLSRIQPAADLRAAIDGAGTFGGSFVAHRFVLFRSHLGGGPPRYEVVDEFPLA